MYLTDRYRPNNLDGLIGQDHVIKIIKKILLQPSIFPKNFIFNGPTGVGKTSLAKILGSSLGQVYEYDSTVLGNVDDMRTLKSTIDNVFLYSNEYRALIFNEIQSASKKSQELLLDTLEDNMGSKIFFVFTTTDINKIIDTVRGRCLEFNFHLISDDIIKNKITEIATIEKINIIVEKIDLIVKKSKGHMRDAINYLDIYNLTKEDFEIFINDTTILLTQYIFGGIDNLSLISVFPVVNLLEDLNMLIYEYIIKEEDFIFKLKFFEYYMKYKNYVETQEDFKAVLNILRKLYKGKK